MSPGDLIKQKLRDKGWTQLDLAQVMGSHESTIHLLIGRRSQVTPAIAIKLAQAFGDDPMDWLLAEATYRLSLVNRDDTRVRDMAALYDAAPVERMVSRNWISAPNSPEDLRRELTAFFGIDPLIEEPVIDAAARRTSAEPQLTPADRAWCFRARNIASLLPAAEYDPDRFDDLLPELRRLAASAEGCDRVSPTLSDFGIRLVIVEPLPRTRIDGAAIWNGNHPIVALAFRFDLIGSFWQTLGHELSHIRRQDGTRFDMSLDGNARRMPAELDALERRADHEAAAIWVDPDRLGAFLMRGGPSFTSRGIRQFADELGVQPGIIAAHLQARGAISFDRSRKLQTNVRDVVTSATLTDGWGKTIGPSPSSIGQTLRRAA